MPRLTPKGLLSCPRIGKRCATGGSNLCNAALASVSIDDTRPECMRKRCGLSQEFSSRHIPGEGPPRGLSRLPSGWKVIPYLIRAGMSPTQKIAHYSIVSKLGEGGMGAVYRATDTKLNRSVAIKVLPEAFAEDASRMQRFEREAQVLASLNHPNIAAIYGIEQHAIVME